MLDVEIGQLVRALKNDILALIANSFSTRRSTRQTPDFVARDEFNVENSQANRLDGMSPSKTHFASGNAVREC